MTDETQGTMGSAAVVLAEDSSRANFKTSLVGHQLRQLRHGCWFGPAR